MRTIQIDDNLLLPKRIECYGYGVNPLPDQERLVKVTHVTKQLCGVLVVAESKTGRVIHFAQNATSDECYANTIEDIELIDSTI